MRLSILAVVLAAVPVFAVDNPDVLQFKKGVTFPHKSHQASLKGECRNCHRKEVNDGQIEGFEKDKAHRMCRTCHAMKHAGPVSCKECHKK